MSLGGTITAFFNDRGRDWEVQKGLESVSAHPEFVKHIEAQDTNFQIRVGLPPCKNIIVAGYLAIGDADTENYISYELSRDFVKSSEPYKSLEKQMADMGLAVDVVGADCPSFGRFRYDGTIDLGFSRLIPV